MTLIQRCPHGDRYACEPCGCECHDWYMPWGKKPRPADPTVARIELPATPAHPLPSSLTLVHKGSGAPIDTMNGYHHE